MLPSRKIATLLLPGLLIAAVTAFPARAQGKLEARYTASLAGITIGDGTWTIDISDSQYTASANGGTAGLLRAFTSGQGSTSARGTYGGKAQTSIYEATITTRKKNDEIRLLIANGTVKDLKIDPPEGEDSERVPVTDALRQGVQDPMTATLLRVAGHGDLLVPEACQRTLAIFDGRMRYDLRLAYKRMDTVKAEKGYAGPVLVCSVYFLPVAGYIPSRTAIKYLTKQHDIEIWLAPIAGTRVVVPFRVQGPTPVGQAVLEATHFVSVPLPSKASITGSKIQ